MRVGVDGKLSLRALRESALFWPTLPTRPVMTWSERAMMPPEELAAVRAGRDAAAMIPNAQELADHARAIGRARYAEAVPTLAQLWKSCAVDIVRAAVGNALRDIGTPDARAVLISMIDDADKSSTALGVRAAFDGDPIGAFDRFSSRFAPEALARPGGDAVPRLVLTTFVPAWESQGRPVFSEARAPAWFRDDARWMELCVRLRHHESIGAIAREALRAGDKTLVDAAIGRALLHEPPPAKPLSKARGDLLTRYRAGEHEAVWSELALVPDVGGALREEAIALSRATMLRAKEAVKILSERLVARGWTSRSARARYESAQTLWSLPSSDDDVTMAAIEKATGAPLPPSLRAFWEIVGGIDLVWDWERSEKAPDLGVGLSLPSLDPLSVHAARDLQEELDSWKDAFGAVHPEIREPFDMPLSGGASHKINRADGRAYVVDVPCGAADPIFHCDREMRFVDYLRRCIRWGGFPRLEDHERADAKAFVAEITAGIEPF